MYPSALLQLLRFSCFVIVVCLLGTVEAGQLTPSPHYLDQVFDTIFIGENWDDYGVKEFGYIGNAGELWPWIENVFLGGVYPDPGVWRDASGTLQSSPVGTTDWVGRPRMRTLEGSPETCAYNVSKWSSVQCFSHDLTIAPARWTNSGNKTQQAFQDGFRWQPPGQPQSSTSTMVPDISPSTIGGHRGVYPDGGLVVILPDDKDEAVALVAKLKASDWINLNTRVFIAEFTAYSAITGMYTVGQIVVEITRDGLFITSHDFRNFPRVTYSFASVRSHGLFRNILRLVVEILFVIYFVFGYLVDECKQIGIGWEDPVKEGAPHWRATAAEQNTRKQLKEKLKHNKPTLGIILVGHLHFESDRAQGVVNCIRKWGDVVVVRPYFYEPFNYFGTWERNCVYGTVLLGGNTPISLH